MARGEFDKGMLPDPTPRQLRDALVDFSGASLEELQSVEGHYTSAQIAVAAWTINRMFNSALGNAAIVDLNAQPSEEGVPAFVERNFFAEYAELPEGDYRVVAGSRYVHTYPASQAEAAGPDRGFGQYHDKGEQVMEVYTYLTGVAQEAMDAYAATHQEEDQEVLAQVGRDAVNTQLREYFLLLGVSNATWERDYYADPDGRIARELHDSMIAARQFTGLETEEEMMASLRQNPIYLASSRGYEAWRQAGFPGKLNPGEQTERGMVA